jgi:hypothetical protein
MGSAVFWLTLTLTARRFTLTDLTLLFIFIQYNVWRRYVKLYLVQVVCYRTRIFARNDDLA